MAFNQSNTSSPNGFEKAAGFINLSLPTEEGQAKLGAIPLKLSSESEKWLIEYLTADPANIEKLKQNLIVSFHLVKTGAKVGFKLG